MIGAIHAFRLVCVIGAIVSIVETQDFASLQGIFEFNCFLIFMNPVNSHNFANPMYSIDLASLRKIFLQSPIIRRSSFCVSITREAIKLIKSESSS